MRRVSLVVAGVAALALSQFGSWSAQAASQAGVAAVVVGGVEVASAEAGARQAEAGMDVFLGDRVTSQERSRMQVLLLDETVFTVGPRSDLVIDEFVFDPASDAGQITASITKGVFRYVSGKIARAQPAAVKIKVPDAVIGIRGTAMFGAPDPDTGGMFYGLIGPGPKNNGDLGAGGFSFTGNNGQTQQVYRAGYGMLVQGGVAGPVIRTPARIVTSMQRQLTAVVPAAGTTGAAGGGGQGDGNSGGVGDASGEAGQTTADNRSTATSIGQLLGDGDDANSVSDMAALDGAGSDDNNSDPRGLTNAATQALVTTSTAAQNSFSGRLPFGVNIPYAFEAKWTTISDLDLHLNGPLGNSSSDGRFHVYFSNVGSFTASPYAVLDADRSAFSTGSGSEVIGVSNLMTGGNYVATVFNFSNQSTSGNSLSNTANLVMRMIKNGQISRGPNGSAIVNGTVLATATAPTGQTGNAFVGITFNPSTLTATATSTFTSYSSSSSVTGVIPD